MSCCRPSRCAEAAILSLVGRKPGAELSPYFPWQMLLLSLVAILICIFMGSVLSLRRVIKLEPAIVFK